MRFGGQVWRAPKAVNDMDESDNQQEAQHDVVDLSKDEPKVIASLVQYLYSGEYDNDFFSVTEIEPGTPPSASEIIITRGLGVHPVHGYHSNCKAFICKTCCKARGPPSQLLDHSKMYAIADKYDVTGLKELACKSFRRACGYFWNYTHFAIAVDHVFSSTVSEDTDLRSIIIQTISTHMAIVKKPEIQALVLKHGDLAIGILLRKMG
ncbi:uncharacterized protein J4E87_001367 [Alternaria ethzedia]|uniref:uncharacterized protein n=1 Tax=Alternaria ethzedia TaxID=181014 RepID=UPI0020C4C0C3|nr:uncharacterized protein J4E87_001367 [Alternaria ethzedia]KAI4634196.1 hypothetical protein J4E87_001367 [Alternaria ethzedia]